jgi:hypothetical protein
MNEDARCRRRQLLRCTGTNISRREQHDERKNIVYQKKCLLDSSKYPASTTAHLLACRLKSTLESSDVILYNC